MAGDQDHNQNDPDTHEQRVHALFMEAIELPEAERTAFVKAQCSDDPDLAAELLEMLSSHVETVRDPSSGRDASASGHATSTHLQPGQSIGPFKILEQLGEGGFGEVYLAEQIAPVKRRVALKVIKLGMDTKSVIARFEAERQALAMMDYPGIARVYEAGATPEGRPYFVMEYVKGEPITTYCDKQTLDTRARLALFVKLCDAIQHAHQKGIIHRDLKPRNILVTINDRDEPQPKVIDFGIAKATTQKLTEKTLFTQRGQLIGTPEYMSPEQAEMSAADIDTRSDVYSLGVILYEMLTGRVPFEPCTLRKSGLAEIQRIIRTEEPPKPSTKLTTISAEDGAHIADARKTKIAELQSTLRRELEWIPLRALRKARTERYISAEALGRDVGRYLSGEPLEAGPLSKTYRLRKLLRRNTGLVVSAALITLALVVGIIASTLFALDAQRQDEQARQEFIRAEAVKKFMTETLFSLDPVTNDSIKNIYIRGDLSHLSEQITGPPQTQSELKTILGLASMKMGLLDEARHYLEWGLEIRREHLGADDRRTLESTSYMVDVLHKQGKYAEALDYHTEALQGRRRVLGDEHEDTLRLLHDMGTAHEELNNYDKALFYYTEALDARKRVLGDDHRDTVDSTISMARLLYKQDEYEAATPYFAAILEHKRKNPGVDKENILDWANYMGDVLHSQGKYVEALPYYTEALEINRRVHGPEHANTRSSSDQLSKLYRRMDADHPDQGYAEKAESLDQENVRRLRDETSEAVSP